MPRVPEEFLKEAEVQGIEYKTDKNGALLGIKGPWLPHWYDNYTEMLRENMNERRTQVNKQHGLNEHGQTPAQEKSMQREKIRTDKLKDKAELAGVMAEQAKG